MQPLRCAVLLALGMPTAAGFAVTRSPVGMPRRATAFMAVENETPCQDDAGIRADAEAAFRLLDLDGDGTVSYDELASYLRQFKYTESASQKIYDALDMDGCGTIHLDDLKDGLSEYCRCSKCEVKFVEKVHAEADGLFAMVDTDSDGEVSADELRTHLVSSGEYTEDAADAIFVNLDADGSGGIDRQELRDGFVKYALLREAVIAVVTNLVKNKLWSPKAQAASR